MRIFVLPRVTVTAVAFLAFTTAACSSPATTTATTTSMSQSVTMADGWVKAADAGMSAAFGELTNNGSTDVTVTSATSPASTMLELHETVDNEAGEKVMRPKDGGFTIPAGSNLTLAPGGNHIMLMDLTKPITAGQDVTFTLTFADSSTHDFTVAAKDYSGANETYEGGMSGDDMSGDMGGDMSGDDMGEQGHS